MAESSKKRCIRYSLDCIVIKCHQDKRVINKSIYLALAINCRGQKELLGLWIAETEGSKFWLKDMKAVAADLEIIYRAISIEQAEEALLTFSEKWDEKISGDQSFLA